MAIFFDSNSSLPRLIDPRQSTRPPDYEPENVGFVVFNELAYVEFSGRRRGVRSGSSLDQLRL